MPPAATLADPAARLDLMSNSFADRSDRLLRAWLRAEGLPSAQIRGLDPGATGFEQGLRALAERGERAGRLSLEVDSPWLRLWAGLPPGARDLIALRVLAGFDLPRIARLQQRPLPRIEREWLLLGRRLAGRDPKWCAALRNDFITCLPATARRPLLRAALALAALACFAGAAFAPQLHYALLLDPAQQRLQAPPAPPSVVEEEVPLSSPDFALWLDSVDFELLQTLDFLLWRREQGGAEPAQFAEDAPVSAPTDAADTAALSPPPAPALAAPPQAGAGPETTRPEATPSLAELTQAAPIAPPAELQALAPWAALWPQLDASARAQLQRHAEQWQALDAPGRERFEQRRQAFEALPPVQRVQLRERHARYQALQASQRAEVQALWSGLAEASEADRRALRQQFAGLPLAVRQALLTGKPADLAELAREAFAFVPATEREATLDLLRALPEAERDLLRGMARRLDAAAREALRAELLALPAEARPARVRERAASVGLRPAR